MDYKKLSEKNLAEIMAAIRKENGKNITGSTGSGNNFDPDEICADAHLSDADSCIDRALVGTQIGMRKATMYRKRGLARKIARVLELIYLRVAELTNRDLRDFSGNVIQALRILRSKIERLFCNDQVLENRIKMLQSEMDSRFAVQTALEEKLTAQAASQSELTERLKELSESLSKNICSTEDAAEKLRYISSRMSTFEGRVSQNSVNLENRSVMRADSTDMNTDTSMFYHDFEERFRGSQEDILQRLYVYRDVLTELLGSFEEKVFVDLGCGRGEMLDFIRDNGGTDCVGVDINPLQLSICEGKGHRAVQMDCLAYLCSLEPDSVDMVSAIQLAEHLPFEMLALLLEECARVLRKGGVILFETPNCNNLLVASTWFYVDPTHHHPLHPELLRFMAERSGFGRVQIVGANSNIFAQKLELLHEEDASDAVLNKNFDMLNSLLYGDQDYALIGVKQ